MNIAVVILLCCVVIVGILIATGTIKFKHKKPSRPQIKSRKKVEPQYINPKQYKVGLIKQEEFKSANQCNDKVLYPIQQLDVDYGSKAPDNCPCMQFIQAP